MANKFRILKRIGLGLLILLAIVLIANVVFGWLASQSFERRVAELRSEGEPTSILELEPAAVPPDQDAGLRLSQVVKDAELLFDDVQKIHDFDDTEPTPKQLTQLRERLAADEDLFTTIHEASLCPQYRSQIDFTQPYGTFLQGGLNRLNQSRMFARILRYRALVSLADNRPDDAMGTNLDLLRISRLLDNEPMIVGYLISLACRSVAVDMTNRTLRHGPVSPEQREALKTELLRHDGMAGFRDCLRTDRAFGLDAFRSLSSGWKGLLLTWTMKRQANLYLDNFEEMLAIADQSWHESTARRAELKGTSAQGTLVQLLWPALDAAWQARDRVRSQLRCLGVLNAMQVHKESTGQDALGIAELDLPEQATTDPFTGKPLILNESDEGWVIYSVGADEVDDGGKIEDFTDFGIGPIRPGSDE